MTTIAAAAEAVRTRPRSPMEVAEDDQLAAEWRAAFADHGLDLSDPSVAATAHLVCRVLDGQMNVACARVDMLALSIETLSPALLSIGVSIYEALHATAQFVAQ